MFPKEVTGDVERIERGPEPTCDKRSWIMVQTISDSPEEENNVMPMRPMQWGLTVGGARRVGLRGR